MRLQEELVNRNTKVVGTKDQTNPCSLKHKPRRGLIPAKSSINTRTSRLEDRYRRRNHWNRRETQRKGRENLPNRGKVASETTKKTLQDHHGCNRGMKTCHHRENNTIISVEEGAKESTNNNELLNARTRSVTVKTNPSTKSKKSLSSTTNREGPTLHGEDSRSRK